VSSSALSEILNGKRRVSKKMARRLTENLSLDPIETRQILELFNQEKGTLDLKELQLSVDQYKVISDWYHFAVLSLAKLTDFRDDSTWISGRLGITHTEARTAVERLVRLGLFERNGNGELKRTKSKFMAPDGIQDSMVKKFHSQILELAQDSLAAESLDRRDFSCTTLSTTPSRLKDARTMIRRFHQRLTKAIECEEPTEVYALSVQLFPTKNRGGVA